MIYNILFCAKKYCQPSAFLYEVAQSVSEKREKERLAGCEEMMIAFTLNKTVKRLELSFTDIRAYTLLFFLLIFCAAACILECE